MRKFVFVALICFCFSLNVFAQAKIKVLRYEVPKYSPAAAAIGVKGEFIAAVKINNEGKVISVNFEKIHPLLKKQLNEAANKWIFSANKTSEEREVEITFEYRIKIDNSKKNYDKPSKEKISFKKSYCLIITRTVYSMTPVY